MSEHDWHTDMPVLNVEPMLSVPTLRQAIAKLDRRHEAMSRWQLICGLLVDHERAHRDLLDRLAAWPCAIRQRRGVDDPAERAQRSEAHARGAARRLQKRAANRAAQDGGS